MRTNIDIDDELMKQAMASSDATTKKAVVEEALRLFVQIKGQGEALRELWGLCTWKGPDDDWFAPDPLHPEDDLPPLKTNRLAGQLGGVAGTPQLDQVHEHDSR